VHPPPPPSWADFNLMMACRPESGHCQSLYSVRFGKVRYGTVRYGTGGTVRYRWYGTVTVVRYGNGGTVRYSMVRWHGMVWYGMVWYGMVW
jgi:hypothetical protein